MRKFLILLLTLIWAVSCNSSEKSKKGEKSKKSEKTDSVKFTGFAPYQEKLLKEPRKSNTGAISFYPEDPDFETFTETLKKSILKNDKKEVAKHVFYPITLYQNNQKVTDVHSDAEFRARYAEFFTPAVRKIFAETKNARNTYRDELGFQLGTGEVIIGKFNDASGTIRYLITNINDAPLKPEPKNQP